MAAASNLHQIFHRRPPPVSPPSSFLKPLRIFKCNSRNTLVSSLSHHRSLFLSKTQSLSSYPIKASIELEREVEVEVEETLEEEDGVEVLETRGDKGGEEEKLDKESLHSLRVRNNGSALPSLTVKEKKELASYAHSLGNKLKSQLVGKSGVNSNVATSFVETLEANELLKIKIHRTCPGELEDVVVQLEELTGSVVVGKIGRTVILYRPSPTKLEAEEKKRQHLKMFEKRKLRARTTFQARGARPMFSGRGRRGSSRVSES